MAKKSNLLPLLLLGGAALAVMAFSRKKKPGKITVEPTTPITEGEFMEETELPAAGPQVRETELSPESGSPVDNVITQAAGGAASKISQLAEETTGTIEAVQAAAEKAAAAAAAPVSVIKKIREQSAAKRAARKAAAAARKAKRQQATLARQAKRAAAKAKRTSKRGVKKLVKRRKLFGDGMPEII